MFTRTLQAGVLVSLLHAASTMAQTADVTDLQRRLEEQERKTAVLEPKLEIQDETTKAALPSTPVIKAGSKGFSIASQDNANGITFRGLVHIDGRNFTDNSNMGGADQWQATRVRPWVEVTLYNFVDFRIMPDFGRGRTVLQDAWSACNPPRISASSSAATRPASRPTVIWGCSSAATC